MEKHNESPEPTSAALPVVSRWRVFAAALICRGTVSGACGSALRSTRSSMSPYRPIITLALFGAILVLLVGCGTFRWGQRDELGEVASTKERESHYWPAFKPDRDLQDPLWTP